VRAWIGLFRGINVGGHNKVPMKDLVTLLCGLGLQQVRTYIQSGNVVFRGSGTAAALIEDIGAAVSRRFGFRPLLVLLDAKQLAQAAAANPFPRRGRGRSRCTCGFSSGPRVRESQATGRPALGE